MAFMAGLTVIVKSDLSILLPVSCFIIIFIYTSQEKLEDSDFAKCTTVCVPSDILESKSFIKGIMWSEVGWQDISTLYHLLHSQY
jgi:hypothetical protein